MLPDAITSEAAKAARITSKIGNVFGWQMIAATITEIKVINKLRGRVIFTIAVSFSVNSFNMLLRD